MTQSTSDLRKNVWLIDDDETTLLLAEDALQRAGFGVRGFADATTALAASEQGFPDVIVVDVVMPGVDGFEFCRRFRELPGTSDLPILMTTSLDDHAAIERAFRAGATNFATKPINWDVEVHRLHYLLKSAETARELRRKEQENRLAKDDWEQTFNAVPDVILLLDKDLNVLRANRAAAERFSKPAEALVGGRCCDLFHACDHECASCPSTKARAGAAPACGHIDCDVLGSPFEVTVSPVFDANGSVSRLVHVARDLSEKRQLEQGLRQAQKLEAIGTLAGGIAHDFNNLLTVMHGFADILIGKSQMAGGDNPEAKAILEAAKRGGALAKQLLIFSRKGALESDKRPMDLNNTIQSLAKMLQRVLPKTVSLETKLGADVLPISADSGQIGQVLMNLAVNSAHAMAEGGTLTIATTHACVPQGGCPKNPDLPPGDYARLTVTDTGHGMDEKTLERIYEPFFTTKKAGEGTGLGLSVVFGIVRDHDGCISCESRPGAGTTFTILLPVVSHTEASLQNVARPYTIGPGGKETILVVDDELPIRMLIEQHLKRCGYSVISAPDGGEALRTYREAARPPSAVILDLGMPHMSGWECLEHLRRFDPQVRVLVATGFGGAEVENHVYERGALGFLHKPFDLMDLSLRLRQILDTAPKG